MSALWHERRVDPSAAGMYLSKNYDQIHAPGRPGSMGQYLMRNRGLFGLVTQFLALLQREVDLFFL